MRRIALFTLGVAFLLGASAQGPTEDGLRLSMKKLMEEINSTKQEIEALKKRQTVENAEQAKYDLTHQSRLPRPRRRRTQLVEIKPRTTLPVLITPRHKMVDLALAEAGIKLRQSEQVLVQVKDLSAPPSAAARQAMIDVVLERNALKEKIRRHNNRRACRWFHVGCLR